MADSSTSSTSQSHSEKTQPFHFRATFETQDIQLIANIRKLHQHTIKLSIKNLQRKQSYNTQEKMTARNQPGRNQTKDLKCATHLLSDKFRNMSEEKKIIVRDLGFGGLMHIPPLRKNRSYAWVIDTTKRRFHILDPLHKKAPSDERKQLNKFTGYVISRMRAYAGGKPLKKDEKEKEIKASYVNISGQKSTYDCGIYVMKWLELIEPENIKRGKYEWDNWKQDEVDHYRVEYASQILFSEMNKERDQAIRASNAIRLSKPSSVLLNPFCQINSTDIEIE
ncbi:hypothetical protein Ahy_A01g004484 [Arachis hypogaea]|uniref:Ubiquitin-like protease family profile domain-containing protein n=1 Tax=Arachis hypogaea TaxID=3818 RepID=A0A445EW69_ARAHY|nr:hypothetical protein Ahy_A01g004484 [Arachis hypogaea]